jgi:hypothetical protein
MTATITSNRESQTGNQDDVKTYTGYVAFLDVLGFRSIINSANSDEILKKYVSIVDKAILNEDMYGLEYVIFSDSVIVNSFNDDDESFFKMLDACATLFNKLLMIGIPVRGAIAHGRYQYSNKDHGKFVAGKPIVEAYTYEGKQDWIGIMLCPSVTSKYEDLKTRCSHYVARDLIGTQGASNAEIDRFLSLLSFYQIPFHKENMALLDEVTHFEGYAVLPTGKSVTYANIVVALDQSRQSLEIKKMAAPGPKEQDKYRKTIYWLNSLVEEWKVTAQLLNRRTTAS